MDIADAAGQAGASAPVGHELSAKQREKLNFIWSVKETLRDHYKRHQYQDVILPFCVLRRLDCVLEPTKQAVVDEANKRGSAYPVCSGVDCRYGKTGFPAVDSGVPGQVR